MEKDCNAKIQMPDLSEIEFIGEIKEVPAWEMGVKITICVSIELVAIVGNLLIIIIIAQSPKMRNVTNYYILNLAISDLLVGLFAIWIHLVDDLTQGWVLGSFLCKFNPFMQSKRLFFRKYVIWGFFLAGGGGRGGCHYLSEAM